MDDVEIENAIDDIVITIINDGRGDQCGYSYEYRVISASTGMIMNFIEMVRRTITWMSNKGVKYNLSASAALTAASRVAAYYENYIKESNK